MRDISFKEAQILAEKGSRTWGVPDEVGDEIQPVPESPAPSAEKAREQEKVRVAAIMDEVAKSLADSRE